MLIDNSFIEMEHTYAYHSYITTGLFRSLFSDLIIGADIAYLRISQILQVE